MWLVVVFFSCVSKGTHELTEVQLDATRIALSARNAQCYTDLAERDASIVVLEEEIARTHEERRLLTERARQLDEELDARRKEIAALVTEAHKPLPPPKKGELPTETEKLILATADDVLAAMEIESALKFETQRRAEAYGLWVARFQGLAAQGYGEVVNIEGHTVVRLPSKVIFNEGRVTVSPRGEVVLKELVAAVKGAPAREIDVIAHTDDSAYHTADFDSSWELGFAQAMAIVRTLADAGVEPNLSAGSAAGTNPIAPNTTPEGRDQNRRIELWVEDDLAVPGMEGRKQGDDAPAPVPDPGEPIQPPPEGEPAPVPPGP
jgi:chemotaxis protein MotB